MFGFLNPANRGPSLTHIDLKEAISQAAKGDLVLIDVRDISEVKASGKAKGALHIPLSVLQMKADPRSSECNKALSTEKPVALYCASGARSNMAGSMLLKMGYAKVHNIGGFGHWAAAGGPVERV